MSVVLVHGLWHDPAHFDLVAAPLRAAGVEVAVPELHRGSLAADTAAVQAVVDEMAAPPVVLGHSYGGSVITGLTGVAHLVYVAAFVPDHGESAASLGGPDAPVGAVVRRRPDGWSEVDPDRAAQALYADCPDDLAAWALALLRPQAPGCARGVPERTAWRTTASTYAVCTQDRAVEPDLQRRLARRCTTSREWPTSHSPFISRPDLVLDVLDEVRHRSRFARARESHHGLAATPSSPRGSGSPDGTPRWPLAPAGRSAGAGRPGPAGARRPARRWP